jgi:hypothetical protein
LLRSLDGPLRDAAIVTSISVAMWLVNGIFDSQLADKYLFVVPGILIAIASVSARAKVKVAHPEPTRGRRGGPAPVPAQVLVGAR